jgi:hypothetical protein
MNGLDNIITELRTSEPYLDDGDFTAGVMRQLPEQRTLPWWIKNLIILSATVAGSALAAWELPVQEIISALFSVSFNLQTLGAAALVTYLLSGAALWLGRRVF